MSTAITCPKCAHVRSAMESAPEWQCPRCGVAYAKAMAPASADGVSALGPSGGLHLDPDSPAAVRRRKAFKDTGQRPTPLFAPYVVYTGTVAAGLMFQTTRGWVTALSVLAVVSFFFWYKALSRKRVVENFPTSRIASAAQGYVEIEGRVALLPGHTLVGALSRQPCAWYHYSISERRRSKNGTTDVVVEQGSHGVPFLLRDGSGECVVNPSGAEIDCEHGESWRRGDRGYGETSIRPGDSLHVIGRFSTQATREDEKLGEKTADLLKSWLSEPQEFFARFDADGNGRIAPAELARARGAARAELSQAAVNQGGLHSIRRPGDGRPYLIFHSDDHGAIVEKLHTIARSHMIMFFIALGFIVYNLA